jgi:Copper transport outer membrane protein, MctB
MFDFRYHALSLVAVFLALIIGLLLGVAIGDRGLVSSAERNVRDSLRHDVKDAQSESSKLRKELAERRRFEDSLYPLLVGGRLSGERIGLIGLGGLPDSTIGFVRDALKDSGGRLSAVAVVREPVTAGAVSAAPPAPPARRRGRRAKAAPAPVPAGTPPDSAAYKRYGKAAGTALVRGGGAIRPLQRSLLESSSGKLDGLNAVVLVRADRNGSDPQAANTNAFEDGLVSGLETGNTEVVGAEQSDTNPSQISWFNDRQLTSVDDIDQLAGQAALVFALAGASGTFGSKDSASALLPNAPSSVGG